MGEELTAEAAKLTEIRQAITIENKKLEELHDIDLAANTLEQLIQEHVSRNAAFETEMAETESRFEEEMAAKKADWKREQDAYVAAQKEAEARLKKDRDREKEEYEYTLALARRKEKDQYEAQKAALQKALKEERQAQEQELAAREAMVATQEEELARLSKAGRSISSTIEHRCGAGRPGGSAGSGCQGKAGGAPSGEGNRRREKGVGLENCGAGRGCVSKQNAQVEAFERQSWKKRIRKFKLLPSRLSNGPSNARALKHFIN